MDDLGKDKKFVNTNQPQQSPENPVISRAAMVQETIDLRKQQADARSKLTESVVNKRKQTAALHGAERPATSALDADAEAAHAAIDADAEAAHAAIETAAEAAHAVIETAAAVTNPGVAAEVTKQMQEKLADSDKANDTVPVLVADLTPDMEKELIDKLDEKFINDDQPEPELEKMSFDEVLNLGMKDAMFVMDMLKKEMRARELRDIEMHNSQMDTMIHIVNAMNNVMEALKTMCNRLSDINDTLTDIKYN